MNAGEDESNRPVNKKLVHIALSSNTANDGDGYITGDLIIPLASPKPSALIIFAHGSGSGSDSPRNPHVAQDSKGIKKIILRVGRMDFYSVKYPTILLEVKTGIILFAMISLKPNL